MQTLKNKAFRVSIQWNALVRKLLALERGGFTSKQSVQNRLYASLTLARRFCRGGIDNTRHMRF
ncbi:hypothetical protein [Helicobacter pylori]|uniref:hypothetical protein n=1 Tax=Helicobacter pylori TaxID=210 RepID=UPI0012FEFE71|nr:hypothetical protein [Helicobacter pylori]